MVHSRCSTDTFLKQQKKSRAQQGVKKNGEDTAAERGEYEPKPLTR